MHAKTTGLLSGEEIRSEGLIHGAIVEMFRASTYDLSIGEIVPGGKKDTALQTDGGFRLQPGGMVRVVARESLSLPNDITGHALPRNTLCTQGVLAINIGIVDPGYAGPISSTLINFGAAEVQLAPGMPFLRVSFHRCPASPKASEAKRWDRDEYIEHLKLEVKAYSAPTFLNLDETVKQAAEGAFGKFKNALTTWVAVAAAGLAAITILVPLGASYADRYLTDRRQWEKEAERAFEQRAQQQYAVQVNKLEAEVARLQRQIDTQMSPVHTSPKRANSGQ
ncbi:MAG TPA: hypothetical protein VKB79_09460 [Bryobacteraceae bacterium]|nr:hypothetical protein [Bryobacteraceae bacterium]